MPAVAEGLALFYQPWEQIGVEVTGGYASDLMSDVLANAEAGDLWLTLQTHQFFGSVADCWAGTRGVDIARILAAEIERLPTVSVWLDSTAVGCSHRILIRFQHFINI